MTDSPRSDIKGILPLVFGITLLGFIDNQMIHPILRFYADDLGATVAVAGLVIGMYSILNTPANIIYGPIMDRFGRKIPLIAGLFVACLSMFLYTLCSIPKQLILIRGLHGLGGAVVGPATASLVADYSSQRKEGRGMGTYGIAMGLAPLIGMMICAMVMRHNPTGFNMVFYAGSALLLIGVILSSLLPKTEVKGKTEGRIDFKKIGSVSRRKANVSSYVAIFSLWFVFGGIALVLPGYMKGLGMEPFHVSMVMVAITAATVAFMYPAGVLSDKIGRKIPAVAGLILLLIGVNLIPVVKSFNGLIAVGALSGIGMGTVIPSILATITDNTERGERGTAMGMFNALLTLGVAVGAPLIGVLAGIIEEIPAMRLSTLLLIASVFAVLFLVQTKRYELN